VFDVFLAAGAQTDGPTPFYPDTPRTHHHHCRTPPLPIRTPPASFLRNRHAATWRRTTLKGRTGYGNFDIILDHLSRTSQLHPTPTRTACYALHSAHADRVLIGGWNPMLWTNLGLQDSTCIHGVSNAGNATVFPHAINLGASFDLGLVNRIGSVPGGPMTRPMTHPMTHPIRA